MERAGEGAREGSRERGSKGARERGSESVRETVPFLFTRENRKFKATLIGGPKQEFIIGSPLFLLSPMSELDGQFLFS